MPIQRRLSTRLWGTFKRVFPRCSMISQAIAFNVFLAFFPTLLLAVGLASGISLHFFRRGAKASWEIF